MNTILRVAFFATAAGASCLGAAADPGSASGPAGKAEGPASAPAALRLTVLPPPDRTLAGRCPAAILAVPGSAALGDLATLLQAKGFALVRVEVPAKGWTVDEALATVKAIDEKAPDYVDRSRLLLVAAAKAGPAAIALLRTYRKRVAGAVFISMAPLEPTTSGIQLWLPPKVGRPVPVWVTLGRDATREAQTMVMWRRSAAQLPEVLWLTLDSRPGPYRLQPGETVCRDLLSPDPAMSEWLGSIAGGKVPLPGPDRQAEAERRLHQPAAAQLLAAMRDAAPLPSGKGLMKRDGPLHLRLTAPAGWSRDGRGEKAYDAESNPFVQIYLTPEAQGPLFVRACGARWDRSGADLLDEYLQRLAKAGFLLIPHKRWTARDVTTGIASVVWPGQDKWHRWLVLMGARSGAKLRPVAPLVLVMDASLRPRAIEMAGAFKQVMDQMVVGIASD